MEKMTKLWAKEQFFWGVTKGIPYCLSQKETMKSLWGHPKRQGPAELPDPAWESKGLLSTLYHSFRVEVNAQSSPGGPLGHLKVYPKTNGISNQRKAMVVQICFNQDNSLSNMKFNEDKQNLQIIKNQKEPWN